MTPRLRSLTFRQLEMLATIAQEGSFRRAANVLTVSESAISQQVRVLEHTMGARLFERSHRAPLRATEAGRRLLSTTNAVVRQLEDTLGELSSLDRAETGCVAFGVGRTFHSHLLPVLYASFHKAAPGITVRAESGVTGYLVDRLLQKHLDLALLLDAVDDPRLSCREFGRVDQVLIGPQGHRLQACPAASFEALAEERLIPSALNTSARAALERRAAELRVPLHIGWEIEGVEARINAVGSGLGIGMVPYFAAKPHIAAGTVTLLRVEGFPMRFSWYLASPAGDRPPFVQALEEHLEHCRGELEALSLSPEA